MVDRLAGKGAAFGQKQSPAARINILACPRGFCDHPLDSEFTSTMQNSTTNSRMIIDDDDQADQEGWEAISSTGTMTDLGGICRTGNDRDLTS